MPSMVPMISPIFRLDAVISRMARVASSIASPPRCATCVLRVLLSSTCRAVCADWPTVPAS